MAVIFIFLLFVSFSDGGWQKLSWFYYIQNFFYCTVTCSSVANQNSLKSGDCMIIWLALLFIANCRTSGVCPSVRPCLTALSLNWYRQMNNNDYFSVVRKMATALRCKGDKYGVFLLVLSKYFCFSAVLRSCFMFSFTSWFNLRRNCVPRQFRIGIML